MRSFGTFERDSTDEEGAQPPAPIVSPSPYSASEHPEPEVLVRQPWPHTDTPGTRLGTHSRNMLDTADTGHFLGFTNKPSKATARSYRHNCCHFAFLNTEKDNGRYTMTLQCSST